MSAPTAFGIASTTLPHLPPLLLRNLAAPVASSALHERQFLLFIEARQAAKKPGKRRTSSEKNSSATGRALRRPATPFSFCSVPQNGTE
jgi:hypothetical protein